MSILAGRGREDCAEKDEVFSEVGDIYFADGIFFKKKYEFLPNVSESKVIVKLKIGKNGTPSNRF